ncbi:MAG: hypothetical protein FJW23_11065 [Acidimicrobiia bacterium]|nr:hypothetical protein [Acidimicrobiia bacterium]
MERHSVEAIVRALNGAGVRYLIADGLAVVAHGHLRFTADVDLILDLETGNVSRAITALQALGYRPRAPVPFEDLAKGGLRAEWARDRNMTVFSVYSPAHPATDVDIFVEAPVDFEAAYRAAARMDVSPGAVATFLGRDDLIRLKQQAGRPQDILDVDALEKLRKGGSDAAE